MCLEILVKAGSKYTLSYIPGSIALTDPPSELSGLFKQRRRWINGSLFASLHVLNKIFKIWHSRHGPRHGPVRKILIFTLYLYMQINMVFQLLLVGTLASTFYIFMMGLITSISSDNCYPKYSSASGSYFL